MFYLNKELIKCNYDPLEIDNESIKYLLCVHVYASGHGCDVPYACSYVYGDDDDDD